MAVPTSETHDSQAVQALAVLSYTWAVSMGVSPSSVASSSAVWGPLARASAIPRVVTVYRICVGSLQHERGAVKACMHLYAAS